MTRKPASIGISLSIASGILAATLRAASMAIAARPSIVADHQRKCTLCG